MDRDPSKFIAVARQFNSQREIRAGRLLASEGPWPFTSRQTFVLPDSSRFVWQSRHHRKRLNVNKRGEAFSLDTRLLRQSLWMPSELNWWIGILFAIGSLLFMAGSILSLSPTLVQALSIELMTVNAIFFMGSIPFTLAAYLQLFQAANAPEFVDLDVAGPRRKVWFGWHPQKIGWLSCALQFPGTLFFNVNTLDAMIPGLNWLQQDFEVWIPNILGSVLFLASGHLAFAETSHAHFTWKPGSISWWVTFVNLLGCVAFMISAVVAFVPPTPFDFDTVTISVIFTLLGAAGFLAGSLLMLPETARPVSA